MLDRDIKMRIISKMESKGIDSASIESFLQMVKRASHASSGFVPLAETSPPDSQFVLDYTAFGENISELEKRGKELISKVAVIKLNGGRSTSMGGLPKCILEAKNGRSYLDIIVGQIKAIRKEWNAEIPLILMNSFFTDQPTKNKIKQFNYKPITFIQNQVPRLIEDTLTPLDTGTDDDWAPPGHGDIYDSLKRSGILGRLLAEGKRWAFISNIDNLAAYIDPSILGLIESEKIDFLLEVTDRTAADRKGGTLIIRNGKLDLLEIAQVTPEERETFMDINRFKVFNTNNVWVDLEALSRKLEEGALMLPIIQNRKNVEGIQIIQLETAMGAAIGSFDRARGLRVGRERFFPTKKVGDLFLLQSDACILDSMDRLQPNPLRPKSLPLWPTVFFSSDFLDNPQDMFERFEDPSSVSLIMTESLEVSGPVFFEKNIRIEGIVKINAPLNKIYRIPNGTVLKSGSYP